MKTKPLPGLHAVRSERGRVQRMCNSALDDNRDNHHFLYGALQALNWILRMNGDPKVPAAGAPSVVFGKRKGGA